MEKLHENFYVARSPVYELFILMLRLAELSTNSKKDTYQTEENTTINEWVREQQAALPEEIVDELQVFFHPDSFFGLSMTQVFYQLGKYEDINESLELLKNLDSKKLVSFFFNTGQNTLENEAIIHNPSDVHDHVKNSTLPLNEKTKLFYLYYDPEYTMERFIHLIAYCYENVYKQQAEKLDAIHQEGMESIKQMSLEQLHEIFNFDHETPENTPDTVIIFPSYYHQNHSIFSYDARRDIAISIAGIQLIEELADEDNLEEKVIELARALSDSKRLNIIRELNKAPRYGYELAQRLELSSPTISHHMSVLFRLGIVTTSKYENKIYYEVNKEKLKQAIDGIADFLT